MIMKADEIMKLPEFMGQDEIQIQNKLNALEILIRGYTHNNFQVRSVRCEGSSNGKTLFCVHPFIQEGDTVQISQSDVNDGLFVVIKVFDDCIQVDKGLFPVPYNMVTLVKYPDDVRQGIVELMKWEQDNRQKVGIKSESLSRHSVTYYDQDANNQVRGYPVSLLGFLESYKKARF